ncbi:hypothetical protein FUAX_42830 (plasmid) [Fulvitalea axinellae]|uniref:S9 family peptidase n=1 Tax=Fulvitalea axinellae TaxID=1182444 RepID=A0AAU9CRT0_9BACT|nr:hypothetical protein FUAX_42830 [Fulvitalea axinellae]
MRIILLSILMLVTAIAQAQPVAKDFVTVKGPSIHYAKKAFPMDIVAMDEDGYYGYSHGQSFSDPDKYFFDIYDKEYRKVTSHRIPAKLNKRRTKFEAIVLHGGEIRYLSSYLDMKRDKRSLFIQTINKKSGETLEYTAMKIGERRTGSNAQNDNGKFWIKTSEDNTKLMVLSTDADATGENEKLEMVVYNAIMTEMYRKTIKLQYPSELFDFEQVNLYNNGDVLILGRHFKEVRMLDRAGVPNYRYRIFRYERLGQLERTYPIFSTDRYLHNLRLTRNRFDEIICAGFYSINPDPKKGYDGVFSQVINSDTERIVAEAYSPFGETTAMEARSLKERGLMEMKPKEKRVHTVKNLVNKELIPKTDGGIIIISEQVITSSVEPGRDFSIKFNAKKVNTASTLKKKYAYKSILVTSVNQNGDVQWSKVISKSQGNGTGKDVFASFTSHIDDDKLYLFWNDNPENTGLINNPSPKQTGAPASTVLRGVRIDKDGNAIETAVERGVAVYPSITFAKTGKKLTFFSWNKRGYRFTDLNFRGKE